MSILEISVPFGEIISVSNYKWETSQEVVLVLYERNEGHLKIQQEWKWREGKDSRNIMDIEPTEFYY